MAGTGLPPFSAKGWLNNPPKFLPAWNATWTPLATQNATLPVRGWGSDSFRSSPRAFRIKSPYSPIVPKIQSMVGVGTAGAMDRPSGLVWSNEDFTQRTWANASTAVVHMQQYALPSRACPTALNLNQIPCVAFAVDFSGVLGNFRWRVAMTKHANFGSGTGATKPATGPPVAHGLSRTL